MPTPELPAYGLPQPSLSYSRRLKNFPDLLTALRRTRFGVRRFHRFSFAAVCHALEEEGWATGAIAPSLRVRAERAPPASLRTGPPRDDRPQRPDARFWRFRRHGRRF